MVLVGVNNSSILMGRQLLGAVSRTLAPSVVIKIIITVIYIFCELFLVC